MLGGTEKQEKQDIFNFTHSNKELHDLKSLEEPSHKPMVEEPVVAAQSRAVPQRNVFEYHQSSEEE